MFVIRCLAVANRRALVVACFLCLYVVCCSSLCVARCLVFAACCALLAVRCLQPVVCLLFIV